MYSELLTKLTPSQRSEKVILITGCSTGFGRDLSILAIKLGYKVVVTARDPSKIEDIVANHDDQAIALQLDVTNKDQIQNVVQTSISKFGRIDVLINNAGGNNLFYSFEELGTERVRKVFELNFFGLLDVTHAVLPQMRKQKSGHIVNISSIAGLVGFPGSGAYAAAKHAVNGISDSLRKEVAPSGIKVMVVCPSGFRTKFGTQPIQDLPTEIEDYAESSGNRRKTLPDTWGNQPGDSKRAEFVIIKAIEDPQGPFRLFLGKGAYDNAIQTTNEIRADLELYHDDSVWADFQGDDKE